MKKLLLIILLLCPLFLFTQTAKASGDSIFKARVIEILEEKPTVLEDNTTVKQQNLKLIGLEGDFKDQEVEFIGIGNFDVLKKNLYEVGDKVLVVASFDDQGNVNYYITDYVRTGGIWFLGFVFILTLLIVGGIKAGRSILSLVATFLIIIKFIIPRILAGSDPLFITILGSLIILVLIIYLTEGINRKSNIGVFSIFVSLMAVIFLSEFFVNFIKLSGLSGEDVFSLVSLGEQTINFQGLLLAGIVIGSLGVLDDVVISQVAAVEQIIDANPEQSRGEVFRKAYKIGVSHISSMTNTLFLAYAGASLPLLILFISGQSAFSSWGQIINNEMMATEIVRTLTGSIGLILSVPISTAVAVWRMKK